MKALPAQKKPLFWLMAVVGGVLLLFLVASWARYAAEAQFASQLGPLAPEGYNRPAVKTEANAGRWFLAAAAKLSLEPGELPQLTTAVENLGEPKGVSWGLLQKNRRALELAYRGASLWQSFYGVDYSRSLVPRLPQAPELMWLGRLLYLQIVLEPGRSVQAFQALGSLAASLEGEAGVSLYAQGLELERLQLQAAVFLLGQKGHGGSLWQDFVEGFSRQDLARGYARVVGCEAATLRQALPPRGGIYSLVEDLTWARQVSAWTQLGGLSGKIWPQASERFAPLARKAGLSPLQQGLLWRLLATAQAVASSRQLVKTAWAVRGHVSQHGAFPQSLSFLPGASQPLPFSGQPLHYRAEEDQALLAVPGAQELWVHVGGAAPPFSALVSR